MEHETREGSTLQYLQVSFSEDPVDLMVLEVAVAEKYSVWSL